MRVLLINLFVVAPFLSCLAQVGIVTDPTSYTYYGQQLAAQAKQHMTATQQLIQAQENFAKLQQTVAEAQKQTSFIQEAREAVRKVNKKLRTLSQVERTLNYNKSTLLRTNEAIQYCRQSDQFTDQEIGNILYNFTQLTNATNSTLSLLNAVLTDGFFEMSDAERIDLLTKLEGDARQARQDVDLLYDTYRSAIDRRQLVEFFSKPK